MMEHDEWLITDSIQPFPLFSLLEFIWQKFCKTYTLTHSYKFTTIENVISHTKN